MPDSATLTRRVLDALVSAGLVTAEQVRVSEASAADTGTTAGQVLVQRDLVTPVQIANVLEEELGVPRVDLESYAPDESALRLVPGDVARAHRVIPLFEIEGMLTVAIGDPIDVFELDTLAAELGVEVEAVLADAPAVQAAIVQHYGEAEATEEPAEETAAETPAEEYPAEEPAEQPEAADVTSPRSRRPPISAIPPKHPRPRAARSPPPRRRSPHPRRPRLPLPSFSCPVFPVSRRTLGLTRRSRSPTSSRSTSRRSPKRPRKTSRQPSSPPTR